tara:strand:+ start:3793 stop:4839 length:1047 start_codon:yes stop_codon:yes gene_type:complete
MKICLYTPIFYPYIGGIQTVVFLLANEFVKFGHDVTVVTEKKNNLKTTKMNNEYLRKYLFRFIITKSIFQTKKIFQKQNIVLINTISLKALPVVLLSGVKFFIIHHTHYYTGKGNFKFYIYIKAKISLFFKNITPSKFVHNIIGGRAKVITNPYDDYIFKRNKVKKTKDFIFCGRLVSDKGADILLDAFSLVLKKYKKSTLTIVGEGPEYHFLKNKADKINLFNNINFIGSLYGQKLNNKFNEHYCMVVPSRNEAFGVVALEGLATTQFVITSNNGGLPEAINSCGQVVRGNYIELSKAMINFLTFKKKQSKLKLTQHLDVCKKHLLKHRPRFVAQKYLDHITDKTNR